MKLTGFIVPGGDKAYFFSGDRYARYDVAGDAVDPGYPLGIGAHWPGLFDRDIDAVLPWPSGAVYVFRGDRYVKYDLAADRVAEGYPRPIADHWPGLFTRGIDAAVLWPDGRHAYFFSGSEYVKYDVAADRAVEGYPRSIADHWPGLFGEGIEAALAWPSGAVYFVRRGEYVRYDVDADRVADGYPKPIAGNWPGLPFEASGAARPNAGASVRDAFPAFATRFEGRVPWMYLDINGLVTVGVGNLIDPESLALGLPFAHKQDGTPATVEEIRTERRRVKTDSSLATRGHRAAEAVTEFALSEAAIDDLVRTKLEANTAVLMGTFPEWNDWPADARLGVLSMAWGLGAGFPARFPRFTSAARAHDWKTAAVECHIDATGNPGVVPRNEANRQLFVNASAVEAKGLDRETLYYPAEA
jgi:GH24 family phage-related lysozyme (muramidase)